MKFVIQHEMERIMSCRGSVHLNLLKGKFTYEHKYNFKYSKFHWIIRQILIGREKWRLNIFMFTFRWNSLFYVPELGKSSEYDTFNSMSVKFGIGHFSGNGLKTVTSWPLWANSFINAECTVMWLLAGMGNIPRILAPSVAYRYDKSVMSIFSFHFRSSIMYNDCPNIIFLLS
jgi:hypothetical protein